MNYLLSFIAAACIAIMLVPNGQLTQAYDVYASTFIIHFVGFIAVTIMMWVKKERFRLSKGVPAVLYFGGLIGIGTTMFNSIAFGKISVSAILALSLFAQAVVSLVIDHFGLFNMPVQKFNSGKLVGFLFTLLGIGFLLNGSGFAFVPIVLSLLTGITVVLSRTVNAELSEKSSIWTSSWYNYCGGMIISGVLWIVVAAMGKSTLSFEIQMNPWIYAGGLVSVVVVTLLNVVTKKMSAFILTLIMFVGQLFAGMFIDTLLGQTFSMTYVIGGILAVFGLGFNLWIDYRKSMAVK